MPLPTPLLRTDTDAHKNDFGHLLIVAGSEGMMGAAVLTCSAAMRAGAGLVTLAVPRSLNQMAQIKLPPVVMTWPLPETDGAISDVGINQILEQQSRFQTLAMGPGLGRHPQTQNVVQRLFMDWTAPAVIDADGLFHLTCLSDKLKSCQKLRILTPHQGEFKRLLQIIPSHMSDSKDQLKEWVVWSECFTLLKGSTTHIVAPDGRRIAIQAGNVGLATAGSGDVYTGILSAFLAQGLDPWTALTKATHLHGLAADLAAKDIPLASIIATDIITYLPKALAQHLQI